MAHENSLSIARWKYDKEWVYSITYDEALTDLARYVIPVHQELGIPGHVEVVAGQIGEVRNIGGSSFDGMRHMDASELRGLIEMGWGVGCHSWSHLTVMDNPDLELRQARETIEDAVGRAVTVYTAPGSNVNLTPEVLELLPGYGYLAGMSVTDDINYAEALHPLPNPPPRGREQPVPNHPPDMGREQPVPNHPPDMGRERSVSNHTPDMGREQPVPNHLPDMGREQLWLNRVPIHERYWGVFDGAFDVHKRIRQAQLAGGWIVDYCHCPLPQPMHDYKDVTAAHHRERLETIVAEGGRDCWYADPDEVVDYRYMRSHSRIEEVGEDQFVVHIEGLPKRVRNTELTLCFPDTTRREVEVDGGTVNSSLSRAGIQMITVDVSTRSKIRVWRSPPR